MRSKLDFLLRLTTEPPPAKEEEDMYTLAGAAYVMTSFVPLQCTSREQRIGE